MEKRYWTVPEVALALKMSIVAINKQLASGQTRGEMQRGKVAIPDDEVQRLLQKRRTPVRSERLSRS